ncbi:MAG: hypothetical protein WCC87_15220 [Candidatus Korobacteraceae bacterium]
MDVSTKIRRTTLAIVLLCSLALAADFTWDWHNQEVISRNDPSIANTSKLKEADRTALIDAITARLQKPMSDRGYTDDRIREVASIVRIRMVDLGGKAGPVVLASSISMEGGCDGSNCPLWIFQNSPDGYVSLLDTVAASYTLQPDSTNGFSDIVTMRHVSASESTLTLYRFDQGKYVDSGCYTATWPPPKDGEIQNPEISPCKTDKPETK